MDKQNQSQPVDIATERTFAMIKPDGVMRGLIGEIIGRFEKRGLKIIALKLIQPTREQIDSHYPKEQSWIDRLGDKALSTFAEYKLDAKEHLGTDNKSELGQQVRDGLLDYLTMGPVVCLVIEGVHACSMVRKLVGDTKPLSAIPGTIRGDFSVDAPTAANMSKRPLYNLIHASEFPDEAQAEIEHWFSIEELHDYYRTDDSIAYGDKRHVDFSRSAVNGKQQTGKQ